jgi:LmeA-like phospholipid-binding
MSYEPTQPMRPPAKVSPGQGDGPRDSDSQGDQGQGDAAQADSPPADSPPADSAQGGWGQGSAVGENASDATVPRAVLGQGNPPPSSASHRSAAKGDPSQDTDLRGGWGQGDAAQGNWDQGNGPQGNEPGGNGPQNYGPQGYGPQGYGPQDDGPQGYGPQGYGPQDGPPPGPPPGPLPRPRRRRRPVRRSVIALFTILVIAILLVIGNFVGKAIAENDMADQFTANGFPVKPSVNIEGFPFLTQVVQKDFKKVVISANNIPAGPVTISSLNATITGMHLNSSWNGAKIDHLSATAFVSLNSLTGGISSALGDAASLTAVPDGPNKLKITGTVLGLSASGEVEIKQTGPQQITIDLPTSGGLVGTLIGSSASFPINLPAGVPPSLRITGLSLNGQGLTLSAAATNATFSK